MVPGECHLRQGDVIVARWPGFHEQTLTVESVEDNGGPWYGGYGVKFAECGGRIAIGVMRRVGWRSA